MDELWTIVEQLWSIVDEKTVFGRPLPGPEWTTIPIVVRFVVRFVVHCGPICGPICGHCGPLWNKGQACGSTKG